MGTGYVKKNQYVNSIILSCILNNISFFVSACHNFFYQKYLIVILINYFCVTGQ
jgi:hypothetical protein